MMVRVFGHYVSKAYLILGGVEFGIALVSLGLGAMTRFSGDPTALEGHTDSLWITALLFAALTSAGMLSVGLYQRGLDLGSDLLVRIGLAFLFVSIGMSLSFYLVPGLFVGRGVLGYALGFAVVGVIAARAAFYRLTSEDVRMHRVLVLGTGKNAAMIQELSRTVDTFGIAGYLPVHESEDQIPADQHMSVTGSLLETAVSMGVDEIVVAVDDRRRRMPVDELLACKMQGLMVLDMPGFFEKEASCIRTDLITPGWFLTVSGFRGRGLGQYGKRLFDLSLALVGVVLASPLMLLTVLAILWESGGRGPVLYHQTRVGLNGRLFKVHKFRSMQVDAEADGQARWAQQGDSRVTRVGAFIRKTRLDELPQFFNVLRGEMSLVGPRPERPEFVDQLKQRINFYDERHRVMPGLTGWAQLCYPYGASEEDARQKLQYDLYYVKNTSFFLDMIILLETVEVILWRKGAR